MTFIFLGMWFLGEILMHTVLSQYYFQFYPVIAIIFLLFSLIMNTCNRRWEKKIKEGKITLGKVMNNFMTGKIIKLFVCLIIIFCYIKFIDIQRYSFLVCFMTYYLVFLALETLAVYSFEKRVKLEKKGKNKNN